eukprot:gene4322-8597_t
MASFLQDGPEAQRIASVIPFYPFHGIPRFYDISGMLSDPEAFQLCIDVFAKRYASLNVTCIAGVDARGFVLGPPIALALKKPFIMIRKQGKLPNSVDGPAYFKEYQGADPVAGDILCISKSVLKPEDRVLVIDDLVATGGTLIASCDLIKSLGATVVECACIVELKGLGGKQRLQAKHPEIEVYGLISEDILTLEGKVKDGANLSQDGQGVVASFRDCGNPDILCNGLLKPWTQVLDFSWKLHSSKWDDLKAEVLGIGPWLPVSFE